MNLLGTQSQLILDKIKYLDIDINDIILNTFNYTQFLENKKNSLSIFHMNIRSLNNNYQELVTTLALLNNSFNIIVLSEIWNYNIDLYRNLLDGYNMEYCSPSNRAGGCCVFYKVEEIHLESFNTSCILECDNISLSVKHKSSATKAYLICIYRNPNKQSQAFVESLNQYIESLGKIHKNVIIAGDFNIQMNDLPNNKIALSLIEKLSFNNISPLILSNTRCFNNSNTLIDNIFMTNHLVINDKTEIYSGNIKTYITDHFAQYTHIAFRSPTHAPSNRPFIRQHTQKNIEKFRSHLENINMPEIHCNDDTDNLFYNFDNLLSTAYESYFPFKKMSKKEYKNKPWFTKDLRKQSLKKAKLHKKWKETQTIENEVNYKKFQKQYKQSLKQAEEKYHFMKLQNIKNDTKHTWKHLNSMLGHKNNKPNHIEKITEKGTTINDSKQMANLFNTYFSEIGITLQNNTVTNNNLATKHLGEPVESSFYFFDITQADVSLAINKLNISKSTTDKVPAKIFKQIPSNIIEHLTNLFNHSVKKGLYPERLKESKVFPIYKAKKHDAMENYRPISILSYIDKIFERLIFKKCFLF